MLKKSLVAALCAGFPVVASAQSTVFAWDHRGTNFFSFPVDDPNNQTQIGAIGTAFYATFGMDFNTAGDTLYVIDHLLGFLQIGMVDKTTGDFTAGPTITGGPPAGTNETGLAVDPTNEQWYMSTGTQLFELDINTGEATLVGAFSGGATLPIEISFDSSGQMYAHDIGTDGFYRVDKATAATTLIGLHGLPANFAQGMDFDPATGMLWAAIYFTQGTGSWGHFNVNTGVWTEVMPLINFPDPQGNGRELEFAIMSGEAPCYPDCTGEGTLDIFDFLCFQDAFVQMDPYANCDGNAVFDIFDFLCFQDAFVVGCQ